jgi:alkyl sulfatase BDS1-like metallo-beta-lactamase superfamily hydrolase
MPPTHSFDSPTETSIAGLKVVMTPAPSDCDDSITIWFPELGVCINNMVWPTLFNVFPIRGEEYRDPRVLLTGLDHIHGLQSEYLLGAHGPPISGREAIAQAVTLYRDSIQFLWDQTVRGINKGLTLGELCESIHLPAVFAGSYLTTQYYGVVEHHVRQIHSGLRGWFDGDEAALFPLPPVERAKRLVAGFGGAGTVRAQAQQALADNDLRWALELGTWLIRADARPLSRADAGNADDRAFLAQVLRTIGQRTTAANIRNWCLTRALDLEGKLDLRRFRRHRFSQADVLASPPQVFVHTLRVILDPARSGDLDEELAWRFTPGGEQTGLHLRHGIAAITDGTRAKLAIELDLPTWAAILAGKTTLREAMGDGRVKAVGDPDRILGWFACFEHPGLGA